MAYNKKYADWGKKVWIDIIAPSNIFNEIKLGETPINKDNIENVVGRKLDLNLAFILNNFRYQNFKAIFKINKISGTKAYSDLVDIMLYPAYIRRVSRKGTSKIEESFEANTKDNYLIKVKPLIITKYKAHREQKNELRKSFRKYLEEKIPTLNYYELIEKMINYDLQNEVKQVLNKIFPVNNIEIRRITYIKQVQLAENK
ncbi:30S ribosomal protein S3Ae [Nanobdella aerobiophila]|uniref:30S ribosomal protein S3Ae n=1 Tax=Nanobdella aerobiophila TaxID=2586965 RepID=A0A915SYC3_9ARCH|nr:hypothetical protein [Nanobdella aerobiophila]BBL45710.1 30S ribosomal protein S3Ae [Nanobdella aerobiophila]